MRRLSKIKDYSLNTLTYVIIILSLLPLLWFLQISFKPQILAFEMPPKFIFVPTMENYISAITENKLFLQSYLNSIIISTCTTVISLLLGITSGYSLARATKFKVVRLMGIWIILTRMAPPMIFLLPFYLMLNKMNLLGTHVGIIITYLIITVPFVTWMMSGFFKTVPVEIEESAFIDGCSRIKSIFLIDLPVVLPGIVTCAIFTFIMSWNEFLYALIISDRDTRTVPIMIQGFMSSDGIKWGQFAASGLMVTIPVLIVTMIFQKGFVRGLTGGAIK